MTPIPNQSNGQWRARRYVYADGQKHNPGRWGIYFCVGRQWELVGGALEHPETGETVAFIADLTLIHMARNRSIIQAEALGYYVVGESLLEALRRFKVKYPDPVAALVEQQRRILAAF